MDDLLRDAAARAIRYRREVGNRPVWPRAAAVKALGRLDEAMPSTRQDDAAVLALLDEIASPATVATSGGRFFGFVTGSSLPATLAANWLAGAWDQNAGGVIQSPAAARLEEVATQWMLDVLGLPDGCGAGFVTCATIANFSALAAARHALFARKGWDVEKHGLFGAPPITVLVGEEVHVSVLKALGLLGLGRDRVVRVPVDDQGRMRADALPPLDDHTILCIQAGNVNTGAFDPADAIVPQEAGRPWVPWRRFGLWAAALRRGRICSRVRRAESWATDAHNDNVRTTAASRSSANRSTCVVNYTSPRTRTPRARDPTTTRPIFRRARGVEVWQRCDRSVARTGRSRRGSCVTRPLADVLRGAAARPERLVINRSRVVRPMTR